MGFHQPFFHFSLGMAATLRLAVVPLMADEGLVFLDGMSLSFFLLSASAAIP